MHTEFCAVRFANNSVQRCEQISRHSVSPIKQDFLESFPSTSHTFAKFPVCERKFSF